MPIDVNPVTTPTKGVPDSAITRSTPTEPARSTHQNPEVSEFRTIPFLTAYGNAIQRHVQRPSRLIE